MSTAPSELAVAPAVPAAILESATAAPHAVAAGDPRVAALVASLESGDVERIHAFGREIGASASAHADETLERVRGADLEAIGAKLGEIVGAAQSLNFNALSGKRSSLPVIGALIDRVRLKGNEVLRRFQDVRTQIDTLVAEVDVMQTGLVQRNASLEASFESVRQEHDLLGAHVAAGEVALGRLAVRLGEMRVEAADPLRAQARHDLQAAIAALEKRVADMKVLQHAALQQLPMIRMVQANNRMLVEKFHTVRELTIPAWKRQFVLALSLNEQKGAVKLAESIDDATNAFLLENARMLQENTVATARANQRLVIDVETLEKAHDALVQTMQEVVRINREGVEQRAQITQRLQGLRQAMATQAAAPLALLLCAGVAIADVLTCPPERSPLGLAPSGLERMVAAGDRAGAARVLDALPPSTAVEYVRAQVAMIDGDAIALRRIAPRVLDEVERFANRVDQDEFARGVLKDSVGVLRIDTVAALDRALNGEPVTLAGLSTSADATGAPRWTRVVLHGAIGALLLGLAFALGAVWRTMCGHVERIERLFDREPDGAA
jgi:uncharacterized protein YaaN involved in tellurite resistance